MSEDVKENYAGHQILLCATEEDVELKIELL